ncbi:MAG: flagellar biosynthesis protein FlhB [Desulfobacteraceae bacterium]|nr:flagellar biosynthesis protein FlhB [Desulfobacteraceae bacterium]
MKKKKLKKAAALSYDHGSDTAPLVVAKGQGKIAEKIIGIANANNIPLHEDRNLVQVLDALDLNREIPSELYRAVAEVLVFVYKLNREYGKM